MPLFIFPLMYAIVDIETTGGFSANNRIIEIAIVFHDGEKITGHYEQLLDPGRPVPGFITGLTGIDSGMLDGAPTFEQVADELLELLEGKVFVAHNVSFDYNFIKREFEAVNKMFKPKRLCTVRLSRKIFPGLKSYSLGRLCESRGIQVRDRHRALGDAWATALLFGQLLQADELDEISQAVRGRNKALSLPPNISREQYEALPEATGVYYFHDQNGKVIYIGKAINIKSRFMGHFTGKSKINLKSEIFDVSFELTGSELLALLLEAMEIKRLWPKYNRSLKVRSVSWGIYSYLDQEGFIRFQINKIVPGVKPLMSFTDHAEAWKCLSDKIDTYTLCPKLSGIQKTAGACYDFQFGKCSGACCAKENAVAYNQRAEAAFGEDLGEGERFLIKDKGRGPEEEVVLLVEEGFLSAFGYVDQAMDFSHVDEVLGCLKPVKRVVETRLLLRSFISRFSSDRIIPLSSG
ncbi:DNA polymerase-3 subunit epsilon [Cyclobacterium lianum]|uniref:DNA polymerase-3 subunit epsilon n=1 Tax=Cyclobacterium lianum TaxID=388280 RepID=A0A1M7LMP1_9BACT|nr:exonuclease domain-containing protein [Cyclobacterium lianum]SHM78914.1 DNA polymerase-3 subunit epsilon [Cyclobacterium lianum]